MLEKVTKKLAGVTSEVNQVHVMKCISEGIHPKFETQGRQHQKSKSDIPVVSQCPPISSTSHHWLGSLLSIIIYIGADGSHSSV